MDVCTQSRPVSVAPFRWEETGCCDPKASGSSKGQANERGKSGPKSSCLYCFLRFKVATQKKRPGNVHELLVQSSLRNRVLQVCQFSTAFPTLSCTRIAGDPPSQLHLSLLHVSQLISWDFIAFCRCSTGVSPHLS